MTIPINMTLYRLLVKQGATEQEAEAAASVDASMLATKADLTTAVSELKTAMTELKASMLMWFFAMLIAQASLIFTVLRFFLK